MGLAASQSRFLQLTARQTDLEFKGQQINQARTANAYEMEKMVAKLTELSKQIDPNDSGLILNPVLYNQIENELSSKQSIDRNYELDLKNVDTLHNEVQTEVEAVKKVIDKNVDMIFKTFA